MIAELDAKDLAMGLFAHYPAMRITDDHVKAYTAALMGMDLEVAQAAILRVTRANKFCPSVAELCAACVANARGERRSGEEAYAELMVAVRRFGRCYGDSKPPEFKDPYIARCIGIWGTWNGLCNSPEDDASGRMRFIELYNKLAAQDDLHAVLPEGLRTVRQFGFVAARAVKPIPEALPPASGPAPVTKVMPGERAHYLPPRRTQAEIDAAARELLADIERDKERVP